MRSQEIISENEKNYLVVAIPTIAELFSYGFISSTEKSFVFRKYNASKTVILGYQSFRLNHKLLDGRIFNGGQRHYSSQDIVTHYFDGVGLPAIKIPISKNLKQK